MTEITQRVLRALDALKKGQFVILIDHPDRENEADLILAAEFVTPQLMNRLIRQGSGIVCLALTEERAKYLNLPLMVPQTQNECCSGTAFTVSIDAKDGIETGISAYDRAQTVKMVINPETTAKDLVRPGHLFPLVAKAGGVLERPGHTEGAIDLMKLANLYPAALLSEVMNEDGTMAKNKALIAFAQQHNYIILSVADLIHYIHYTSNYEV